MKSECSRQSQPCWKRAPSPVVGFAQSISKWALSSSLVSSTFLWIGIHSFAPLSAQDAQPFYHEIRPLFENGEHLGQVYHFRNVGLIQCPNGDLLAFVEARHGVSDHKEKDVLMRRSKDRGITWGPYEPIWGHLEEDHAGWKDPAPVVDETSGRLFYFMNTNESEKRLFYMASDDSGHTWSDPIRIPDRLLRDNWKRWRNCPGPGIQLKQGQYKHRLLIPGHIVTKQNRHHSVVWFSDDHGATWAVSEPAVQGSDEVSIVELADGRVLMNIRSHGELDPGLDPKYRNFMHSDDGGETWKGLETKRDLPWESGHGSITRLPIAGGARLLAFHPIVVKRKNLTGFISGDEGRTWPYRKLIHEAGGYSSVIVLDNLDIALSHNHGHRGEHGIDFVRFNLSWLTDGRESVKQTNEPLGKQQDSKSGGILWQEDFALPDGAIHDTGTSAWHIAAPDGRFPGSGVSKQKFRVLAGDETMMWQTEKIDIGKADSISISVDAVKIGHFDESDFLHLYYRLDDSPEVLMESPRFSSDPEENFETYQIRQQDVRTAGYRSAQIIVRARVNGSDKALYWDRVVVSNP